MFAKYVEKVIHNLNVKNLIKLNIVLTVYRKFAMLRFKTTCWPTLYGDNI